MDLFALLAVQPAPVPTPNDAADGLNSAGLGILLWVGVLAVVFFALLAVAGLGLINRRRTRD
jgi:hypothetical protein